MKSNQRNIKAERLEDYRIALENAENQIQIAGLLADNGYTSDIIAQGKVIWTEANESYLFHITERNETTEASSFLKQTKESLDSIYSIHRKKSKVIFRENIVVLDKLGVSGRKQKNYTTWIEMIKTFYRESITNVEIQTQLATLNITIEDLNEANSLIHQLEAAKAEYQRERGESQDATVMKELAFDKLEDWMSAFYIIARVALTDHPQLLESLNKKV